MRSKLIETTCHVRKRRDVCLGHGSANGARHPDPENERVPLRGKYPGADANRALRINPASLGRKQELVAIFEVQITEPRVDTIVVTCWDSSERAYTSTLASRRPFELIASAQAR